MWKNSKPENYSTVGQTPRASGARFVRPHGWRKKLPDEKNVIGAEALTFAGKMTPPKNLPILWHDCEQDATTKKTIAKEINLAFTSAQEQEKAIRQTNWLGKETNRLKNAKERDTAEKNDSRENPIASKDKEPIINKWLCF